MRKGASLWIDDESDARDARVDLLQHCQPLSGDTALIDGQACKIAARPRQVDDEARADRVANSDEYYRNVSTLSSESGSKCCTLRHDHIGTQRDAGGMIFYGPDITDNFRRAADYVDRILKGSKTSYLPVQQPTKFELIINATIAKAIGVTLPTTLLLRADEVIE